MENANNKIITISFIAAGILAWITASVLIETVAGLATGPVGRVLAGDLFRHGVPVAIGAAVFFVAQFNPKIVGWADEVTSELRRIVWPSRKDTTGMTVVVCIMLIISGIFLGLLDMISGSIVDWLVHVNATGLF
jgi:preprotein translocase subunit SecE